MAACVQLYDFQLLNWPNVQYKPVGSRTERYKPRDSPTENTNSLSCGF